MALFFKRVPEMRRFGQRLSELDILEHVDLLRASFVGLEHTNEWVSMTCPRTVHTEHFHPASGR